MVERNTLNLDLPDNSKLKKQEDDKKKTEKIVKGKVIERKKSLGKKFSETFLGDDIDGVASYLLDDVIIPSMKNIISDIVTSGIEMLLYGEAKGPRTNQGHNKPYVSYAGYYNKRNDRPVQRTRQSSKGIDTIILESRGEAEEVLSQLVDLTIDYGQATVADFYDLIGKSSDFTDQKYGWVDLSSASVKRDREGYVIVLPKILLLD